MKDVDDIHKSGVPEKTQKQICWATKVWSDWARQRMMLPFVDEEKGRYELTGDFCAMSNDALNFWLRKIVFKVCRVNRNCYPPDSLYGICTGIQHSLRFAGRADLR